MNNAMKFVLPTISVLVIMAGIFASYGIAQYQISELRSDVKDMQKEQADDHDTLIELASDVKWIRRQMEDRHHD